jgi:hypothetical protein
VNKEIEWVFWKSLSERFCVDFHLLSDSFLCKRTAQLSLCSNRYTGEAAHIINVNSLSPSFSTQFLTGNGKHLNKIYYSSLPSAVVATIVPKD